MKLFLYSLLIILKGAIITHAQLGYTLQHFTGNNGLPVNGVTALEWDDNRQLLYIGTQAGMVCFDGQHFTSANGDEGRILTLFTSFDKSGKHIQALNDNLSVYELQSTHAIFKGKYNDDLYRIRNVGARPDSMKEVMMLIKNRRSFSVWPHWIVPFDTAANAALIALGHLYFKDGQNEIKLRLLSNDAKIIKAGKNAWVIDSNKIYLFNAEDKKLRSLTISGLAKGASEYHFLENNSNYLIAWGNGRVYELQPDGINLKASLLCEGLPSATNITAMRTLGTTGYIALGDAGNGLYLLKKTSVTALITIQGYHTPVPWITSGQALLPDNNILLPDGLIITPNGQFVKKVPVHAYYSLFSSGSKVYYNSRDTLYYYNTINDEVTSIPLDAPTQWAVYAETRGKLYAISDFGIYRVSNNCATIVYKTNSKYPAHQSTQPAVAIEYEPGLLAIGNGPLLCFYNTSTNDMDTMRICREAPVRTITKLGGCLLVGTYGEGIFLVNKGKKYKLPLDKKGSLKFAHSIVPDGNGFCFISTNNGLFKVSIKALINVVNSEMDPIYYHYFGLADGLAVTEFNGGTLSCSLRLPNGKLSFSSMNGLAIVDPKNINAKPPTGLILPDSVLIDNIQLGHRAPLLQQLSSRLQHIRFKISIPYAGASENLYAWYRLLRSDSKLEDTVWLPFNTAIEHDFSFTALKPDAYKFEVKILSGFEPGEARYLSIPFIIQQPWYLKTYSLAGWLVLLILTFIILVKWRLSYSIRKAQHLEQLVVERTQEIKERKTQLQQQYDLLEGQVAQLGEANHLKERLISVISHNIITPLRYIQRTIGSLRDEHQLSDALKEKTMSSIKETSLELELLSVNLLNWIKLQHEDYMNVYPEQIYMADIMRNIHRLLQPVANERGLKILLENTVDKSILQYKDALQTILYNLALNAIVYSTEGTVVIRFQQEGKLGILCVVDQGPGMPVEKVSELLSTKRKTKQDDILNNQGHGFGYPIIKDLIKVIKGKLTIDSKPNIGTIVTIQFEDFAQD